MQIANAGPCTPCESSALCRRGFACDAFRQFVETGKAVGDREPEQWIYDHLYAAAIGVEGLHRKWRREGRIRADRAMRGEVQPLTKKELQRRWRKRERLLFELDPARYERHLERKRRDAMRRERERGRQPLTAERASARCRLAWQRRRERAAAAGLVMSADEVRVLRERLGWTQRELAKTIGRSRAAVEHWELGENLALPSDVKKLRALAAQLPAKKMPAPRSEHVVEALAVGAL